MDRLRKIIREQVETLFEIDWEGDFKDVIKQCISPEKMLEMLNNIVNNVNLSKKEKPKRDFSIPMFHQKAILNSENEINLDDFIKNITKIPNAIIGKNDKMEKSGTKKEIVVKTGIPALKGIVYDIENKKFHIVNTCPGAKDCIIGCYALNGNFVRVEGPVLNSTRVLNLLMNYPKKYKNLLKSELINLAIKNDAFLENKDSSKIILRWNDSGDFFSKKYIEIAKLVMSELKEEGYNVSSYLYTKIADVASSGEDEFITNFSDGANEKQTKSFKGDKKAKIIKREVFKDLFTPIGKHFQKDENERWEFRDGNSGLKELKNRISKLHGVDVENILSYTEYTNKTFKDGEMVDVIVMPGDGDNAAWDNRHVKNLYLLEH